MVANMNLGVLLGIIGFIYYVNTPGRLLCRIPVNTPLAWYLVLAILSVRIRWWMIWRLVIEVLGNYLAGLMDRAVTRVFQNGIQGVVANPIELMSATSAAFGRVGDSRGLLITSEGDTPHVVNHTESWRGDVLAVCLDS